MNHQPLRSPCLKDRPARRQSEGVLVELRRCTHAAHVRINQHPFLTGLTKPAYPLDRYMRLLATYFHLYTAIESQIDAFLAHTELSFAYGERRKLAWLVNDLKHFGIDPGSPDWRSLPPISLAPLANSGELIGVLYVIEGATLGGQVISSHLRKSLALTADAGARFFNGYGDSEETQRRWQEFVQFADSIGAEPHQQRCAGTAAQAVFDLIEGKLNECHARHPR